MASHFNGPILGASRKYNSQIREWFSNKPVDMDPDYVRQMNDFLKADDYNTTNFTLTLVGTGTAAVNAGSAEVNGVLLLTTTNASADSNNLQAKQLAYKLDNTANAYKRLWFEANVMTSNVADVDMFVGLSESSTDAFTSQNAVGFRMTNGAAAIVAKTIASNTATTSATIATAAASTLVKLGFLFDGTSVQFYVNRNWVASSTTNIPTADMGIIAKVKTNSTNARTMSIDYVEVVKER